MQSGLLQIAVCINCHCCLQGGGQQRGSDYLRYLHQYRYLHHHHHHRRLGLGFVGPYKYYAERHKQ